MRSPEFLAYVISRDWCLGEPRVWLSTIVMLAIVVVPYCVRLVALSIFYLPYLICTGLVRGLDYIMIWTEGLPQPGTSILRPLNFTKYPTYPSAYQLSKMAENPPSSMNRTESLGRLYSPTTYICCRPSFSLHPILPCSYCQVRVTRLITPPVFPLARLPSEIWIIILRYCHDGLLDVKGGNIDFLSALLPTPDLYPEALKIYWMRMDGEDVVVCPDNLRHLVNLPDSAVLRKDIKNLRIQIGKEPDFAPLFMSFYMKLAMNSPNLRELQICTPVWNCPGSMPILSMCLQTFPIQSLVIHSNMCCCIPSVPAHMAARGLQYAHGGKPSPSPSVNERSVASWAWNSFTPWQRNPDLSAKDCCRCGHGERFGYTMRWDAEEEKGMKLGMYVEFWRDMLDLGVMPVS